MHRSMDQKILTNRYDMIKVLLLSVLLILSGLLTGCNGEQNDDPADDGLPPIASWQLVWSEEFDGNSLDLDRWDIQEGDGKAEGFSGGSAGWGNLEEQFYSPDNISVENGELTITTLAQQTVVTNNALDPNFEVANPGTYEFTSARIRTQGKVVATGTESEERGDFTYGRVEARMKLPAAIGIWNAFWLLGSDPSEYGGWASKGELDILEAWIRGEGSTEPFVQGAVHYGGPFPFNQFTFKGFDNFEFDDGEYHVYALEWDAEQIRWYVDGFNYYSVRTTDFWSYYTDLDPGNFTPPSNVLDTIKYSSPASEGRRGFQAPESEQAPFDTDFHIIINAAVNGRIFDGFDAAELADPATFPAAGDEMVVDYVRVYQCNVPAMGGAACKNKNGKTGVALPNDPVAQPPTPILANFSNDLLLVENSGDDLFESSFDIYTDGDALTTGPLQPNLVIEEYGRGQAEFVTDSSDGNDYIKFDFSAGASTGLNGIALVDASGEDLVLSGFDGGGGLGDFKFDLYLEPTLEDGTPIDYSSGKNLRVAMTTGGAARFLVIPLADVPVGSWHRFTIPITYIISNGGGGGLNTGAITRFLELNVASGDVSLRLDNIGFACGGQPCGIVGEVNVYLDEVDPIWDRGIVGNDDFEKSRVPSNKDYTDPNCCHVTWAEVDLGGELDEDGEPRGTVVEVNFGTTNTEGAVNFIGSEDPFPSIAALRNGEFQFDIRQLSNRDDEPVFFKIDTTEFVSTGEQPLGDLSDGQWKRFRCPITTLEAQGLDTSKITAPFVLVPGNRGAAQGITLQYDNVRFVTERSGTPTTLALPFVFDTLPGFCLPVAPFSGGAFSIVDNPGPDAENNNARVGQVRKFSTGSPDELFGGISLAVTDDIVFSAANSAVGKAFEIDTYASRVGLPVTVKLESNFGQGRPSPERVFVTTVANQWERHVIDFNGSIDNTFSGFTVILDNGVAGENSDDFRLEFDEVRQIDATSRVADLTDISNDGMNPIVPRIYNFDPVSVDPIDPPSTAMVYPLTDFDEARSTSGAEDPEDPNNLVGAVFLPDFSGNTSGTVIGGAGGFPNPIPFEPMRKIIEMRFWTAQIGTSVALKVESATDANQFDTDIQVANSIGWNTLRFDFSDILDSQTFEKLVMIINSGTERDNEQYYFDDITLCSGNPGPLDPCVP